MHEQKVHDAVQDSIRYLGLRAHSRSELVSKLKRKGFHTTVIDAAMTKLESIGLINDHEFGRVSLESMARRRPEGRMKAKLRLLQKGVSEETIDELLGDHDQSALCRAAAEKKLRTLSGMPELKRKKLETFLRNRGFDWQTIKETVEQLTVDS